MRIHRVRNASHSSPDLDGVCDVLEVLVATGRRAILDAPRDRNGQMPLEFTMHLTVKHELELTRIAIAQHLWILEPPASSGCAAKGRYRRTF